MMQSGCNEITNINSHASPRENYSFWEQTVYQSSEKLFDLAKSCTTQLPHLKVVILTRLSRYDLPTADPNSSKQKLSEYGNNVLKILVALEN